MPRPGRQPRFGAATQRRLQRPPGRSQLGASSCRMLSRVLLARAQVAVVDAQSSAGACPRRRGTRSAVDAPTSTRQRQRHPAEQHRVCRSRRGASSFLRSFRTLLALGVDKVAGAQTRAAGPLPRLTSGAWNAVVAKTVVRARCPQSTAPPRTSRRLLGASSFREPSRKWHAMASAAAAYALTSAAPPRWSHADGIPSAVAVGTMFHTCPNRTTHLPGTRRSLHGASMSPRSSKESLVPATVGVARALPSAARRRWSHSSGIRNAAVAEGLLRRIRTRNTAAPRMRRCPRGASSCRRSTAP